MIIKIGGETEKHLKILDISYPFTTDELKSSYRKLIKKNHPDKGGSKEKSQELNKSYKYLLLLAVNPDPEKLRQLEKQQEEEEKDIFALWEHCTHCNGKGYNIVQHDNTVLCDCVYGWARRYTPGLFMLLNNFIPSRAKSKCRDCNATGMFTLRNGRKVVCRKCKGSGVFIWHCRECNDTGIIFKGKDNTIKQTCFHCEGLGKIKIDPFNPVIRKGAIL